MFSKDATLDPKRERALAALAQGPRNKSRLALETYGDDNASTRSMISRLSKQLLESGWAIESRLGRERLLEITPRGQECLRAARVDQAGSHEPVPAIPLQNEALQSLENHGNVPMHPRDRPRFHLRHAALLVLSELQRVGIQSVADDHYEGMLRTLVHDSGGAEANDKKIFASLVETWPKNDRRKRLIGCLVEFQDFSRRRETGPEFVMLANHIDAGAEAVLWASGAIDLAHHYSFAPASQIDRMTARRLLRRAKELLDATRKKDPSLRVAVDYRLGKIAKVALAGWSWDPKDTDESVLPAAVGEDDEPVRALRFKLDEAVVRAGRFNFELEALERGLQNYLGRWVMLALPSSEWVFRRAGGFNIAKEIEEWAADMRQRGTLNELLVARVKDPESAPLRETLRNFIRVSERYRRDGKGMQLEPYIAMAQGLLDEKITVEVDGAVSDSKEQYYRGMLMNNLWNPEMVAAHTVAAVAKGVV